jgi:hypothetical protein
MPLDPYDWNVVILGRWNRAILTPSGIATRLFHLPPNSEIAIEVPMDAIGPFRVSHRGLTVMVTNAQLVVEARDNSFQSLGLAMEVANRAMEDLPHTPVGAAGLNIRTQGTGTDQHLRTLIAATQLVWDQQFEKLGYPIVRRDVTWVAEWNAGKISVNLTREDHDQILRVNLNFERVGTHEELMGWLTQPIEEIRGQVRRILTDVLQIPSESTQWL